MANLKTSYSEIVDVSKIASKGEHRHPSEIIELAYKENIRSSKQDTVKSLIIAIDNQQDFMPGGSLAVAGADKDIENLTKFIYNNIENITSIMCSLDTHYAWQIFHPAFWQDEKGVNPAAYTFITADDVKNGKWSPVGGNLSDTLKALETLGASSKAGVVVWPYHCIEGTPGHNLEHEFSNMVQFWSVVKRSKPQFIKKGQDLYSEMYGIIESEYNPKNLKNVAVLNAIAGDINNQFVVNYDRIFIAGQAGSHCLLFSTQQLLEYFKDRPEVLNKVTILSDCTSPVIGYEKQMEDGFEELKKKYGINIMKSTDVVF